ncbi:MAG: PAS domain-containing protein, partial [Magnetovibrio sp.]|nr:PAS domain-containing protein [Magnetovibrio sp.]
MTPKTVVQLANDGGPGEIESDSILNALNAAIIAVDGNLSILKANAEAEHFFRTSATNLIGQPLDHLVPADSPVFELIQQVRAEQQAVSEYGVT